MSPPLPRPVTSLHGSRFGLSLMVGLLLLLGFDLGAATLDSLRQDLRRGQYDEVIREANLAISRNDYPEDWRLLAITALLETGKYAEALPVLQGGLNRFPNSIKLRLAAYEVWRANGQPGRARASLEEINYLMSSRGYAFRDPENLVVLGKAALLMEAEPRLVLEQFFDRAKKEKPDLREVYLASGELALEKHDSNLAAKSFEAGLKAHPEDPDLLHGFARAYSSSDRMSMMQALQKALEINPRHIPSLLTLVDHLIDAEDYGEARKLLGRIDEVNPHHPEAWAYRAVLAHLNSDREAEAKAREVALKFWKTNPRVEFLIGLKLSQKYRFTEGAEHQRAALKMESAYLPARIQLAQDLLRLGQEEEGWLEAQAVHDRDPYDVAAYNLVTLRDSLKKFTTLTNAHFLVRMVPSEAAIYGDRVMALLEKARVQLTGKYGLEIKNPVLVELFPEQGDFAIRTFMMPGGDGFLGVCFGSVITANAPGSPAAHESNWEAVLYHEFCHVVTLQLTRNRMPRWLSEGISVYEEKQAQANWGQEMTPAYRAMVLGGSLTKVGELSSAFLAPPSDLHLQFAYYESSLVVEYLIQKYGLPVLRQVLTDLGDGIGMNASLEKRCEPLAKLEEGFEAFAKKRALDLAPGLSWASEKERQKKRFNPFDILPIPGRNTGSEVAPEDAKALPPFDQSVTNYYQLQQIASAALRDKKWELAVPPLQRLVELYPNQTSGESAYPPLAKAYRELKRSEEELRTLRVWAEQDADAVPAYTRLLELSAAGQRWSEVMTNAHRLLAVNPMLPQPYRSLAQSAEALGKTTEAVTAYETLLRFDLVDRPAVQFRLAKLQKESHPVQAKLNVLSALEEAPRFREAQKLLLQLESVKLPTPPALPEPSAKP